MEKLLHVLRGYLIAQKNLSRHYLGLCLSAAGALQLCALFLPLKSSSSVLRACYYAAQADGLRETARGVLLVGLMGFAAIEYGRREALRELG